MDFKEIDKSNYWDCFQLEISESQREFIASSCQSLVEAAYEKGLYILGIYEENTMIGYLLYDCDKNIPGWSLSRFLIDYRYQKKGYGKEAALKFLDYFKENIDDDKLYISMGLNNIAAKNMFKNLGFRELKQVEYEFSGKSFKEIQMVKNVD